MGPRRFSNQTVEQILKHLGNFLDVTSAYDLQIDPLGIYFSIRESTRHRRSKGRSEKREKIRGQQDCMTKRERKLSNTKKRTQPKIRSVKKGRTVTLKGRVY